MDERGYGSVVANFARQALRGDPITVHGDGKQSRCFTYISDTVAGTLLAGEAEGAIGEAFNIGNPHRDARPGVGADHEASGPLEIPHPVRPLRGLLRGRLRGPEAACPGDR